MREVLLWGVDIGLLVSILSTSALTVDAVLCSGIWKGRGWGFRGGTHNRWMLLWDLILGPGKSPLLNDLTLWELAEVLLNRRRVEFGGND